jgi:hypothetical protein
MSLLVAALTATAVALFWRRKTQTITGGRFGGVAGRSADPLAQAGQLCGQLCGQGGELGAQLRDLLMLGQDQPCGNGRP